MLNRQGMVLKSVGTNVLEYTVPAGKSMRIRDIMYRTAAAAAEDISITVDRKLVMQFVAASGMYLLAERPSAGIFSTYRVLKAAGIDLDIPIEAGQVLNITAPGTNNYMEIVYDLYDEGDVKAEEPNGSKADKYTLLQVISNSGVLAAAGDLALDRSDTNAAFPNFPAGAVVPAKHKMILRGLFGAPASKGTGTANGEYTTFLKFLKDREDIFDPALIGINFLGDATFTTASLSNTTIMSRLLRPFAYVQAGLIMFDNPIEFDSGSELNVFATIARTGAGGDFVAGDVKLGLVFDVLRV